MTIEGVQQIIRSTDNVNLLFQVIEREAGSLQL